MLGERLRQIRLDLGWTMDKLATKVGVSQETMSNWETGKTKIPLERLRTIAEATGFPLVYVLGEEDPRRDWTKPVDAKSLGVMHGQPVWVRSCGWCLVNWASHSLVRPSGNRVPFEDIHEPIYGIPPALSLSLYGFGAPLELDEISRLERIWLEPIGDDLDLNAQLRGWYHPHQAIYVTNEFGIRFYLDTYGAKWLAFRDGQ